MSEKTDTDENSKVPAGSGAAAVSALRTRTATNEYDDNKTVSGISTQHVETTKAQLAAQVESFFRRQDKEELKLTFSKHSGPTTAELPVESLQTALESLGVSREPAEVSELFRVSHVSETGGLNQSQFESVVKAPTALEQWANTLPLGGLLAASLPRKKGAPLDVIGSLTKEELSDAEDAFLAGFKRMFKERTSILNDALAVTNAKSEEAVNEDKVSKFSTFKMSCGSVDNFHAGLQARVGAPNLDFMNAMEAEHCTKPGFDFEFTTSNYKVITTPHKEWEIVSGKRSCPAEDMGHGRTLRSSVDLKSIDVAKKAGLIEAEVVALVLYTGPLFQIYNTILRRFPRAAYDRFEAFGNLFSTTIHVLVSAIQKVAKVMVLPEGLKLYCGLGGLMELPDQFWQFNEFGCRGYTEWGFRSTTSNKNVALQYSGAKEGKPLAMVLEITVGSVDRGACIQEFSQYPAEVEYLWVPCSYIEPSGDMYLHVIPEGVVKVIPVRMNANLRTATVEDLLGQKKTMHLSAFRFLIDETKQELERLAEAGDAKERLEADPYYGNECCKVTSMSIFIDHVVDQCRKIYKEQEEIPAYRYTNDRVFRSLVVGMLDSRTYACSKLLWWMEDKTQTLQDMGMHISSTVNNKGIELRDAHFSRISFLTEQVSHLADGSDDKRHAALNLCKVIGVVEEDVAEVNSRGETPFLYASISGARVQHLRFLKWAGADINFMNNADKNRAVSYAVSTQDRLRVKQLVELGVDLKLPVNGVMTPLCLAVSKCDYETVGLLVNTRADPNFGVVYRNSPMDIAKRCKDDNKMVELLKELQQAYAMAPDLHV